jgi:hypothetical protein
LEKRYSLIFIPGFSLQMVPFRQLLKESLLRFNKHLEPDGRLAVSLFSLGKKWRMIKLEIGNCERK